MQEVSRHRTRPVAAALAACVGGVLALVGCTPGIIPPPPVSGAVDGNRDPNATSNTGKTSGEPNDAFAQAIVAVFDGQNAAALQGTIASDGDLDVFLLGALAAGDRIVIDTDTTGSNLDVAIAIFDAEQRLVFNNDDRANSGPRALDAFGDWTARHGGSSYYLVVSRSAFADRGTFTGAYNVDIIVSPSQAPQPVSQILLLDFDGATIDTPSLGGLMTLQPFDAASISALYADDTETIKTSIRSIIEQNFERFDVTIVTTDDAPIAAGTQFSTMFFGGLNPIAFGISESVDLYNVDFCDDAIIFTESFDVAFFTGVPTATDMGVAIGNVASHEAGHLLGLNHVDDDRALMDDQSAADVFLDDQEFMNSPVSRDIVQIGTQDAVLLLNEIVGPSQLASARPTLAATIRTPRIKSTIGKHIWVKRPQALRRTARRID